MTRVRKTFSVEQPKKARVADIRKKRIATSTWLLGLDGKARVHQLPSPLKVFSNILDRNISSIAYGKLRKLVQHTTLTKQDVELAGHQVFLTERIRDGICTWRRRDWR